MNYLWVLAATTALALLLELDNPWGWGIIFCGWLGFYFCKLWITYFEDSEFHSTMWIGNGLVSIFQLGGAFAVLSAVTGKTFP